MTQVGFIPIAIGVLVIALAIPLRLGKVAMNPWYGVRLPKSYASDANWYEMNRYGAGPLMAYGAALVLIGLAALAAPPSPAGAWFWFVQTAPAWLAVPMLVLLFRHARRLP